MRRTIISVLLSALAVISLVSCSDNGDGTTANDTAAVADSTSDTAQDTDAVADTNTDRLIINSEGTMYAMIAPKDVKSIYNVCNDAKSAIYSSVSKNLFVKYDKSEKESQYEILVGLTNRAESAAECAALASNEYRIRWVGDKLVVAGGSNYAAKQGMKKLTEKYFKNAVGGEIRIPADIDMKGSVNLNLDFTGLKDGWNFLMFPADNGVELPFQIYMPKNYDQTKQYPMILQMHSAGVKNADGSQIYKGEAKFLRNLEQSKYANEVIVISPCCPEGEKWIPAKTWKEITYDFVNTKPEPYMVATTELFAAAREKLSVDESRLYVYGMSMGGFATWDLLARNPDLFAAAIPVAGSGDPSVADKLDKTAIWIFHGSEDPTVPCDGSRTMYDALVAAGRTDVKLTIFEGAGHGIWSMTADTDGLLDWLFAQHR